MLPCQNASKSLCLDILYVCICLIQTKDSLKDLHFVYECSRCKQNSFSLILLFNSMLFIHWLLYIVLSCIGFYQQHSFRLHSSVLWYKSTQIRISNLSIYLSVCLSVCPSVCLSVRPSVCPSVRPSVCLYLV